MTDTNIQHSTRMFCIQKDGNSPTENEDIYKSNDEDLLFALADGAADAVYSRRWATLLADKFINNPFEIGKTQEIFIDWLEPLQIQWRTEINWGDLRWYVEEKARRGAFSTFLGLQITRTQFGEIVDSVAIGDTCLFIIHDNNITSMFPVIKVSDFSNTPPLLCSYERYNTKIQRYLQTFRANVTRGDLIILATDAFAKWILEDSQGDCHTWSHIQNMNQIEFEDLITRLRESKKIRNDDTTVACIYLE